MKHQVHTLLLGEVPEDIRGEVFSPHMEKSAPAYYPASVPRKVAVGTKSVALDGGEATFQIRGFPPNVLVIETRVDIPNVFSEETFDLEARLLRQAREILSEHGGNPEFSEEYSVFIVSEYAGPPEQFLTHSPIIASLLKSERQPLADKEIEYTLQAQVKYGRNDLAVIDWDGAFLFDPAGNVEEELELLGLANLQLLRHRILDRELEGRLDRMAEVVRESAGRVPAFRHREISRGLVEIIRNRTQSISQLQRLDREIKLIGDWYSARFYDTAAGKFKTADWRRSIQNKLESIEDIYTLVAENFSVSAKHRAEWAQIIMFFVLQAGWLTLIILEIFYFTR